MTVKLSMPGIRILETAWRRMRAYIDACPTELGGLGAVQERDGTLVVTEVFLIEQFASGNDFQLTDEALHGFLNEWLTRGRRMDELSFWWHSHVDLPAFWSSVDAATSRRLAGDRYCIAYVGNRKGEGRTSLTIAKPLPLVADCVAMDIVAPTDFALQASVREEIAKKVRRRWLPDFGFRTPVIGSGIDAGAADAELGTDEPWRRS